MAAGARALRSRVTQRKHRRVRRTITGAKEGKNRARFIEISSALNTGLFYYFIIRRTSVDGHICNGKMAGNAYFCVSAEILFDVLTVSRWLHAERRFFPSFSSE